MPNSDIKKFIDFFTDACQRIRKEKLAVVRGKDGRLTKLALQKLSEDQLEQMALWFLAKKKTLSPTIGAMLSASVLETLQKNMRQSGFWAEIGAITDAHYPRRYGLRAGHNAIRSAFTARQIGEMKTIIEVIEKRHASHYHGSE